MFLSPQPAGVSCASPAAVSHMHRLTQTPPILILQGGKLRLREAVGLAQRQPAGTACAGLHLAPLVTGAAWREWRAARSVTPSCSIFPLWISELGLWEWEGQV